MPPLVFRFPIPEDQLYDIGNWHSPYFFLAFFETRVALFESFGATQERVEKAGFAIVVNELHSKYRKALLKGDTALIEIASVELEESQMIFLYKVRKKGDLTERIRAERLTLQVLINREKIVKVPLPIWIREPLEKMDKAPWPGWMTRYSSMLSIKKKHRSGYLLLYLLSTTTQNRKKWNY